MELEGKSWDIWMQDLGARAASTRQSYVREFKTFLVRWEVTPDDLYSMRLEDVKSEDPRDHKRIERMVKTLMAERREGGYSAESCKMTRKSVQSFFESQNLELKFKAKDSPKGSHNGQRAVTPEQVRDMCDLMVFKYKLRNRAIVLALKDTGIRISDLGALRVGEYLSARIVENVDGERFKVFLDPEETQKMKTPAYIHLGPESIPLIDQYLQERRDGGEELTPDRYLFITGKDTEYSRAHAGKMTKNAITGIFDRLKKWMPNNGHKVSAHSLRKFHRTRLEGAGMPEGWVKKLQGKKSSVYSQPEHTGELTKKYVECYDALRVFGTEKEEIKKQKSRIEDMTKTVEELQMAIDLMTPAFAMVQKMVDQENELVRLREAAKEPEVARAKVG